MSKAVTRLEKAHGVRLLNRTTTRSHSRQRAINCWQSGASCSRNSRLRRTRLRNSETGADLWPAGLQQEHSRSYTKLVRGYGLKQEVITPHCPEQNGMVERVIRTLKEQCVHRHRFETLQHASRVIGDWISFYNIRRPQALGMKTPAEAYALAV